jgi:dolichol-phosphate mannosyltransferase
MITLLTIFVPAYNEEDNLVHCINILKTALEKTGVNFEILIINDASCDLTGTIADQIAQQDSQVRVVHHSQNLGIGGGFCTAVEKAQGDWLILIPADIALDPDDLHLYIDAASQADVVVGLRSNRDDYSLFRKLVSWVNIHMIQLLFGMKEHQFQFISLYRMEVLRAMKIEYWRSAFFLAEVLIKAKALGYRLIEVQIHYTPRLAGQATGVRGTSIFNTARDMLHFWTHWVLFGARDGTPEHI